MSSFFPRSNPGSWDEAPAYQEVRDGRISTLARLKSSAAHASGGGGGGGGGGGKYAGAFTRLHAAWPGIRLVGLFSAAAAFAVVVGATAFLLLRARSARSDISGDAAADAESGAEYHAVG